MVVNELTTALIDFLQNTALPLSYSSSIAFFTKYQRTSNTNGPIANTPFISLLIVRRQQHRRMIAIINHPNRHR